MAADPTPSRPNPRTRIRLTDEEAAAFLRSQPTVVCATHGARGFPHVMPLWFVLRPTGPAGAIELWAWTFAKSQKARNLERDPRASLLVEAGEEYHLLRGVMLEVETVLHRDVAAVTDLGLEIAGRYQSDAPVDAVRASVERQAPKRVGLQFVERRRVSWDHGKLGAGY